MVVIIWWLTVNEHLAGLPFLSSKKGQSFCFLLRGDLWESSIGKSYIWAVKHYTTKNILVWQKWSFRFFHSILWKNPNKCFGQHIIIFLFRVFLLRKSFDFFYEIHFMNFFWLVLSGGALPPLRIWRILSYFFSRNFILSDLWSVSNNFFVYNFRFMFYICKS